MKKQSYRPVSRRGYTLMEMLLVQGVIVAFVAMSWPALKGSLEKNRLLAAARQVRTELVQARLKATETGVAQQFRYQTGDRCYEVTATKPVVNLIAGKKDRTSVASTSAVKSNDDSIDEECDTRIAMLDEEVSFSDSRMSDENAERGSDVSIARDDTTSSSELGEENWSTPVVFLPNGRSSNARVRLAGPRGLHVDVLLRGLTGAVTVGDPMRDEVAE